MMLKHKLLSASAAVAPVFIEDVFSTYLYTGAATTITVNNGIDLTGEGGMVWIKDRITAGTSPTSTPYGAAIHYIFDTLRTNSALCPSSSVRQDTTFSSQYFNFLSNGFDTGTLGNNLYTNVTGKAFTSWTFRQAPRFFDVVTYTGTGANRTIAHTLDVVPGCIMVKRTDTTGDWQVYHRSNTAAPETDYLVLNSTAATVDDNTRWNDTLPTSTVFSLGTNATVNASGGTYVAYLFAHDPLGPSGSGSDGLIACGSYTGNGLAAGPTVSLGWEPQWLLIRNASAASDWLLFDAMRGLTVSGLNDSLLEANTADAEAVGSFLAPTATGFEITSAAGGVNGNGSQHIYIAIRRGPMREPTAGTEVFAMSTANGSPLPQYKSGFVTDFAIRTQPTSPFNQTSSRLTGANTMQTINTSAETSNAAVLYDYQNGYYNDSSVNSSLMSYMFRRAPGFFDVVAYTGTGANRTISHNLGVAPELMIVKKRSATDDWAVYYGDNTDYLLLNSSVATADDITYWNDTSPTSSVFTVGTNTDVNTNAATYVAYLFASLPGISKVGSYTGNGSSQTINCGFTTGARFILIKRTNGTNDWYVWDTLRGIVSGNDPYFKLNTTDAQVTTNDSVDPDSTGFIVNQNATTLINTSGGSYIYLAIA